MTNKSLKILNYEKTCNISATLVENISLFKIDKNITVKDFFKFNKISLWEVCSCELAHRYMLNTLIKKQKKLF